LPGVIRLPQLKLISELSRHLPAKNIFFDPPVAKPQLYIRPRLAFFMEDFEISGKFMYFAIQSAFYFS
jgi:hypothetical protein